MANNDSFYRCPKCKLQGRESDVTKKIQDGSIRTITYTCQTQLIIMQNGFRFKHKVLDNPKCLESISLAGHGTNTK